MRKQLELYDREERAAIMEHDGYLPRLEAEGRAGVFEWKGALAYLERLVSDREPLIHIGGGEEHRCTVRSLNVYEPAQAATGWMFRSKAVNVLAASGYRFKGRLVMKGVEFDIWQKQKVDTAEEK